MDFPTNYRKQKNDITILMINIKLFYILIPICFFSCKAQKQKTSNEIVFNIVSDTIKCKSLHENLFVTEYIEVLHPNKDFQNRVQNKVWSFFLHNIYPAEVITNLKAYNSKCCEEIDDSCDFNFQEYDINYSNSKFSSITGFFNIYGLTPTEDEFNLNMKISTLEILKISDLLTKKGVDFLLKDANLKIKKSINEEKKYWDDDDLDDISDFISNISDIDINALNNFKIFKNGENFYLKIWYSFEATKFQQKLLPVINLTYNFDELNPYFNKEFIQLLND